MPWYIFAIVSVFLISITTLLEKRVLKVEHATQFAASLSILNLIVSVPLFLKINYYTLTWEPLLILIVTSAISTVAMVLNARSLRHMEVSASSPLYVTAPAVTALLALIFLGEALSPVQTAGIGVLMVGAYLLEVDGSIFSPIRTLLSSKYIHYIFFSILLFSITAIVLRFLLVQYNVQPEAALAFSHLYMAVIFITYFFIRFDGFGSIVQTFKTYGWMLVLISLLTVSYRLTEMKAVELASVGLVIAIVKSSSLFTAILGGRIYHEKHLFIKICACVIMIAGMVLVVI